MRKLFLIIFATLFAGLIPAYAEQLIGTVTVNGASVPATYYKLTDNTVRLGSGKNACIPQFTQGFLVVPGEVTIAGNTYTVTEIADVAFRLCDQITGVEIRENIKRIGKFAFVGCSKLGEITLPASLESIGSGAFINTVTRQTAASINCMGETPPRWEYNDVFAFHEQGIGQSVPVIIPATIEVYVPDGSEDTYKNANYSDAELGWTCPEGWGSFAMLYTGVKVEHIYEAKDLEIVRQIVNHGGKYNFYSAIQLEADIDMSGYKWDWGIGDQEEHPFSGNFYGNGYTISNLTVENKDATTGEYNGPAGLFSYFGGNIVQNLTLKNCTFEGKEAVGSFAGVTGRCAFHSIWIDNCTFTVQDGYIGSLLGKCISTGGAVINECVVNNKKSFKQKLTSFEAAAAYKHGGLVGYCNGAFINDCAVIGDIREASYAGYDYSVYYPKQVNPFVGECNSIDIAQIGTSYATDSKFEDYSHADNIQYTNVVLQGQTPISVKTFPSGDIVNTTIRDQYFASLYMIPSLGLNNWVFQQGELPLPIAFEEKIPVKVNVAEYRPSIAATRVNGLSLSSETPWSCFLDLTETGYRSKTYYTQKLWIDDDFPYNKDRADSGTPSYYLPVGSATITAYDGVRYDRTLEVTPTGTKPHVVTQVQADDEGNPVLDDNGNYIPEGEITLYETPTYAPTGYMVYLPYKLAHNETFRLFEPADVSLDNNEVALEMNEIDEDIIYPWHPYYLVVNDVPVNLGTGDKVTVTPEPEFSYLSFGPTDEYRMYGTKNPQNAEVMQQGRFVLNELDEFVPATEAMPAWRGYFTLPSGVNEMSVTRELKFFDGGDNEMMIEDFDGTRVKATLQGRTFYKDNTWYTLCLPFDVESFDGTPLQDAVICTLESSSLDDSDGALSLNFRAVSIIEAGKPYLIKWADGEDIIDPSFSGVTIDAKGIEIISTGKVGMIGLYSPLLVPEGSNILYLGDNNRLYAAEDNMTINAFRACFFYKDVDGEGDGPSHIKLNFMSEPVVSGVDNVNAEQRSNDQNWYSIDGRVFREKPVAPGIYINNGKKVIIK